MKWYFASRMRHKEKIQSITKQLKMQGEEIVFDWSELDVQKPYVENASQCLHIAHSIVSALKDVDVFVLISDVGGTDMFIELGVVIGEWMRNNNIRIYVVGEHNSRSLMHFHLGIIQVDDLQEVFEKESVAIENLPKF
ncbi:MAG: hypothetical protein ACLFPL_01240 [Candidatus Nanoarchaeia archaeon]